ncbi:MAG: hypothetical protein IK048_03890 [Clostridia bacterium]|nr:hypothetical protein [Clostridia bacterium]
MKKTLGKCFTILIVLIVLTTSVFVLASCDKKDDLSVNYMVSNDYEITVTDYQTQSEQGNRCFARVYQPKDVAPKYGLLFFLGTFMRVENYEYLGEALAKQGYVVIIPNSFLSYWQYDDITLPITQKALELFPDVKFFVGGHSQGGGAALRYICEDMDHVLGAVFYAPLLLYNTRELLKDDYDEYDPDADKYVRDENGEKITVFDTLADSTLPTLLLEPDTDRVLTDEIKQDARERMPENVIHYVLENATHEGFSLPLPTQEGQDVELTEEQKTQIANIINHTLDFLQMTVANL